MPRIVSSHFRAVLATVLTTVLGIALTGAVLLVGLPAPVADAASPGGPAFVPLTPSRLADTRYGSRPGPVAAGATWQVQVAGRGGVAGTGVSAVALNLTAVNPVGSGYLTAYPSGSQRPGTSNLNYAAGRTISNEAIASVGSDGKVTVWVSAATDLVVDVTGYYPIGASFTPATPTRVLDTRGGAAAGDNATTTAAVLGRGAVPSSGVAAVAVNLTATGATDPGYVISWPSGASRPATSTLNYAAGQTVAAFAVVRPGADGRIALFTRTRTQLIVDVVGWYSAGGDYQPIHPVRLVDSRSGNGVDRARLAAGSTVTLTLGGRGGIPTESVGAVQIALTAVNPAAAGYLTIAPVGVSRPVASTVNFPAGGTTAGAASIMTGYGGTVTLYASATTDVLLDVTGYSSTPPATGAGRDLWTAYANTAFYSAKNAGYRGTLPLRLPIRGVLADGWVKVSAGPYAGAYFDGGKLSPTNPAVTLADVTSADAVSPAAATGTVTRYVVMTNFTINVRSAPSTSAPIRAQLGNGTVLTGRYVDRSWFQISSGPYAGAYVTSGELQLRPDQSLVNGKLPRDDVCVLPGYFSNTQWEPATPRFLNCVALASLIRLDAAFMARFGYHLQIDEGYRSLDKQQYFYDLWGYPAAAYPGTSTHGLGLAIDFYAEDDSQYTWGTPVDQWLTANAMQYGWDRPPYYDSPGGSSEYWHYNFVG